jgi:hypothetical protein
MNIIPYLYYKIKYYIENMMWKNYYTLKNSSGIFLISIDYISSSNISEEDHIALKNTIDFYEDFTNIGKSVINNSVKILKKIINYDKSITIYVPDNKSIFFIVNDIMYQYFIRTDDNDKLYGRLYRINIYNNERLEHLYIRNSTRIRILKDYNFLKYIVTK